MNKSLPKRSKAVTARTENAQALPGSMLPLLMGGVGLFAGTGAARSSGDMLVGFVAACLAALMLVALLQALGLLSGR